jgi:hypothetical protein
LKKESKQTCLPTGREIQDKKKLPTAQADASRFFVGPTRSTEQFIFFIGSTFSNFKTIQKLNSFLIILSELIFYRTTVIC